MKKNRLVVSALSLLIGVTLVGSVSGTIAWYQYSTRANVTHLVMSGGTKGNLQFRVKNKNGSTGKWFTRFVGNDISSYMQTNGYATDIQPVTPGGIAKNAALGDFYKNPIAGYGPYSAWKKASEANYFKLDLQFRYVVEEKTDSAPGVFESKEVYLTDNFHLEASVNNPAGKADITDAVRIHISTNDDINRLISKNGGTLNTYAHLDLDGDGEDDVPYEYDFGGNNNSGKVTYGKDGSKQESYAARVDDGILVETNDEDLDLDKLDLDGVSKGKAIGLTKTSPDSYLEATITIWVEGWQEFANSSIWNDEYIGSMFDIKFEFATDID